MVLPHIRSFLSLWTIFLEAKHGWLHAPPLPATMGHPQAMTLIESGSSGERALVKKRKRPEKVMDELYKKFKSDREELMEEMRERERARQERHGEKMELRKQFLTLMAESLRGGDDENKK